LIFTQYTQMAEILIKMIEKELFIKPLYSHGGINKDKRTKMIEKFEKDISKNVFIL